MIDSISNDAKVSKDAARKVLTNRTLETMIYLETKLAVANAIIAEKKNAAEVLRQIASGGSNPFDIRKEMEGIKQFKPPPVKAKKALSLKQIAALKKGRKKLKILNKNRVKK